MARDYPDPKISQNRSSGRGIRPAFLLLAILVFCCIAAVGLIRWKQRSPAPVSEDGNSELAVANSPKDLSEKEKTQGDENIPVQSSFQRGKISPEAAGSVQVNKTQRATAVPSAPARPQPSPYTQQLVTSLVDFDRTGVPATTEQAAIWKQNLQQLIQQGPAALPAIQQFLDKNEDFVFGTNSAGVLGYTSARRAMFDALAQIGGPEAIGVLAGTLQTTSDPREIALLARSLDHLVPEQYRQQAVEASRQILAMAADGKLDQTVDLAPLFAVLGQWSGAGTGQAALEQASAKWKYYSAVSLGQMPDGEGIPGLIHLVEDPGGSGPVKNIAALEVLTQNALQFPDARAALLKQVRANNLSASTWAYLMPVLSGDQVQFMDSSFGTPPPSDNSNVRSYHIASGNQNFYTAPPPGGLSPDQISRQMAFVDELLGATSDPAAIRSLQTAKQVLNERTAQTASVTAPPH